MVQRTSWGATVGTAIAMQWAVVLILSVLGWLWGFAAAQSAFAGGAAVALPNTVLALWLTARMRRNGIAGAGAMMFGELLKLCLTLALLVMVVVELSRHCHGWRCSPEWWVR